MDDSTFRRVFEYTQRYHERLGPLLAALDSRTIPHHKQPTDVVAVIRASDGAATFYLPGPEDEAVERGYRDFDLSGYDLNQVCQSTSVHRFQIAPPLLGEPWDRAPPLVQNAEPIPGFTAPWIHDDIREAAVSGTVNSLPGLTIAPIVHVEAGIRKRVLPARIKVWAPVFNVPGVGIRRLYLWTHADLWWFPEELDLSDEQALRSAQSDVVALQTIASSVPLMTAEFVQRDASTHAADILDAQCDELLALLDAFGREEEKLHQWLGDSHHRLFLDPHALQLWSKLAFGDRVSDFVIRRSDHTYKLVEIEPAEKKIFRASDSEPSAPFHHACQQVRDWKRYIRDNVQTVRTELGLEDIDNPDGMVVMGRSSDIASEVARIRWRDLKATVGLELRTYDELCDAVRAFAQSLRVMFRGSR